MDLLHWKCKFKIIKKTNIEVSILRILIKNFHIDLLQSQEKNYRLYMEENKRNKDKILENLEKEINEKWPYI
jgi:hypothetical protein